jgi:hypothetical protein
LSGCTRLTSVILQLDTNLLFGTTETALLFPLLGRLRM